MDIKEIKNIATSTFNKLIELVDKTNQYSYSMQISTSWDDRVYICLCPLLHNHAIIHEEYDMPPKSSIKLDNTRIVPNDLIFKYIQNMNDIVFVGLQESLNTDIEMVCYYKRKD